MLVSDRPLVALALNPRAHRIVAAVSEPRTATQVAEALGPGSDVASIEAFLDDLAARGLVSRHPPDPPEPPPSITVVIPTDGRRPDALARALDGVARLDWPPDRLEVLVVDDGGGAPVQDRLVGYPGVRVIALGGRASRGPSAARNRGAAEARSPWIAFLDDDAVPDPSWLRRLAPHLAEDAVVAAAGRVTSLDPDTSWTARYEAVRSPLDMGPRGGDVGSGRAVPYVPATNLLVRRDAFEAVGGFDEGMRLGEDVDLVWRLRTGAFEGARVRYVPEATVAHEHRTRLGPMLRRRLDYASSEAALARRHPAARRRLVVPPLVSTVLAGMVAAAVVPAAGLVAWLAAGLALAVEVGHKIRRTRLLGLSPRPWVVVAGTLRSHGAALYHLGAHVTRYHGVPLAIAAALIPPLAAAVLPLLIVPAWVDHRRLVPPGRGLPFPVYLGLWWLEMAAYQAGVVVGCLRHRDARPLFPRLAWAG